ncbi:hypothetical protein GCG54_00001611 [Colletotrichum gloeosporioides]|uniref:DUF6594 domain-containing protein n=1 Tax=Colletotrichum gloeosporioides TaxID=474922 RepID=A0A8H4FR11_COLGL|nr:uncharacterized protein GCG54_00001611 [Colletotrichum gloeosporioides]KAF3811295.1 hypothetical protein GCG54_00001611 [Colletotrichum gloeosporioides]
MLINDQAVKSLHEVWYHEYCNIARNNKDELAYLNHPSDFVNTVTDPLWLAFEAWLYKLPSFLLASTATMRFLFKTLFVCFYAFLLPIPVILFSLVQDMSRAATVGLLASFMTLFSAPMALRPSKADSMLLGVCAYAAVLVALLANV